MLCFFGIVLLFNRPRHGAMSHHAHVARGSFHTTPSKSVSRGICKTLDGQSLRCVTSKFTRGLLVLYLFLPPASPRRCLALIRKHGCGMYVLVQRNQIRTRGSCRGGFILASRGKIDDYESACISHASHDLLIPAESRARAAPLIASLLPLPPFVSKVIELAERGIRSLAVACTPKGKPDTWNM